MPSDLIFKRNELGGEMHFISEGIVEEITFQDLEDFELQEYEKRASLVMANTDLDATKYHMNTSTNRML